MLGRTGELGTPHRVAISSPGTWTQLSNGGAPHPKVGKMHVVQTGQELCTSNGHAFEAATTAIFRKVSNQRVRGLGRLTCFCNPAS